MNPQVKTATAKLLAYCRRENWAGYDPYDALNSKIFQSAPFLNSRLPRIALTQLLKRSPINLRSLLLIPKTQNPKALALFLSSFLRLSEQELEDRDELIGQMIEQIAALRSPNTPYWCWGYSFPWQGRKVVVPAGAANLVCTTFVANALLDAHEHGCGTDCLTMAASAAEYILKELYWEDVPDAGFSYPLPSLRSEIHNANFLAAALLARVSFMTGDKQFLEPALKVARCSAAAQLPDGSWYYGEAPSQKWIDNFHTGYNLSALHSLSLHAQTAEFDTRIRRGFDFYRKHFFCPDGAPKYFHNRTYPIDVHCVAQSILTLIEFQDLDPTNADLANKVFQWAMEHMWDDRGFFYYRVLRSCTIRTSYMRWSQAWMLLAMSTLSMNFSGEKEGPNQISTSSDARELQTYTA